MRDKRWVRGEKTRYQTAAGPSRSVSGATIKKRFSDGGATSRPPKMFIPSRSKIRNLEINVVEGLPRAAYDFRKAKTTARMIGFMIVKS